MIIYYLALLTVIDRMALSLLALLQTMLSIMPLPPIVLPRRYIHCHPIRQIRSTYNCFLLCTFKILVELVAIGYRLDLEAKGR